MIHSTASFTKTILLFHNNTTTIYFKYICVHFIHKHVDEAKDVPLYDIRYRLSLLPDLGIGLTIPLAHIEVILPASNTH